MENHYTDTDGKEKILYHNGYVNYTETMEYMKSQFKFIELSKRKKQYTI